MKKFSWQILWQLIFLFFLFLIQMAFLSRFPIFGVKINLLLIGLILFFYLRHFLVVFLGALLMGLLYDFIFLKFGLASLAFLGTASFLVFFLGRYFVTRHLFSAFLAGTIGTIVFNFLFTIFGYLLFHQSFINYFLSYHHLIEIGLNALGVVLLVILNFFLSLIFPRKNVS